LKGIQARLPELVAQIMNDPELFRDLYRFTFKVGLIYHFYILHVFYYNMCNGTVTVLIINEKKFIFTYFCNEEFVC
jgi:hypothetical protein